jgi:hypothetical protein
LVYDEPVVFNHRLADLHRRQRSVIVKSLIQGMANHEEIMERLHLFAAGRTGPPTP